MADVGDHVAYYAEFDEHLLTTKGSLPIGIILASFRIAGNEISKEDALAELQKDDRFVVDDLEISFAPKKPEPTEA